MTAFLDDCVDDLAGDVVGDAEEDAGDDDEAEYHAGGLRDLLAIRPLDPLQLGPARSQEGDDAGVPNAALAALTSPLSSPSSPNATGGSSSIGGLAASPPSPGNGRAGRGPGRPVRLRWRLRATTRRASGFPGGLCAAGTSGSISPA
jgi:hypothetical protein